MVWILSLVPTLYLSPSPMYSIKCRYLRYGLHCFSYSSSVAALTSTVSLFEVAVAFFINHMHLSRKKATRTMMVIVAILSTICSLSIGSWSHIRIFGKTIFDACDYFSAIILLPVGGLLISIFIGWILKRNISREELTNRNKLHEPLFNAIFFCIKYIAPIIIILIFLSGFGII